MSVKPLAWKRTSLRNVTADGKPTTIETWVARNPLAEYKVYSAVSGRCFVIVPDITHYVLNNTLLSGRRFHSGADELMGKPKTPCASIEEGKRLAEEHWAEHVGTVLT